MQQTDKTYLQLCNEVIREAGGELASFAADGSDFANPTDKMQINIKAWVADAWRDLQQESLDLEWMSEQAVVNIRPGIMFYSPHEITWNETFVNPLTIYDVDATPKVVGKTVLGVVDLTGTYTRTENFGYIDLDSGLTSPLDFGMKAGGEYFLAQEGGHGNTIALIAGAVWSSFNSTPPAPIQIGTYPTTFTAPDDGTPIVNLVVVAADDADGVATSTTTIPVTGNAVHSTGSPSVEVAILTLLTGSMQDFIDAYTEHMESADSGDNLVGVYMEDANGNFYGGLTKCINSSSGNWMYNTAIKWPVSTVTFTNVADTSTGIQDFGGFTIAEEASLVHAHFIDNFLTSNAGLDFDVDCTITTVTLDGEDIEDFTVEVTNNLNSSSINSSDLYQISTVNTTADTDFSCDLYTTSGLTAGIVMGIIDSGDLNVTTAMDVDLSPAVTWKNYVHSWKSFDWSEELGDDDFQEYVREVDNKTFRIISHEQPAISPEAPLTFVPWDEFNNRWDFASSIPAVPRMITEDNTGRWRLYPPPNMPYTILFNYVRSPQELVNATDVPKGLAPDFWKLPVWKALEYYGLYDEQPSIASANRDTPGRAQRMYRGMLMKFELQYRPKFHFKPARMY